MRQGRGMARCGGRPCRSPRRPGHDVRLILPGLRQKLSGASCRSRPEGPSGAVRAWDNDFADLRTRHPSHRLAALSVGHPVFNPERIYRRRRRKIGASPFFAPQRQSADSAGNPTGKPRVLTAMLATQAMLPAWMPPGPGEISTVFTIHKNCNYQGPWRLELEAHDLGAPAYICRGQHQWRWALNYAGPNQCPSRPPMPRRSATTGFTGRRTRWLA